MSYGSLFFTSNLVDFGCTRNRTNIGLSVYQEILTLSVDIVHVEDVASESSLDFFLILGRSKIVNLLSYPSPCSSLNIHRISYILQQLVDSTFLRAQTQYDITLLNGVVFRSLGHDQLTLFSVFYFSEILCFEFYQLKFNVLILIPLYRSERQ